jgi:hypothetical protein
MGKVLAFFGAWVACALVLYVPGLLLYSDPNPSHWTDHYGKFVVAVWLICPVLALFATFILFSIHPSEE